MHDDPYFESRNLTAGRLNAIVKKLGGERGALQFLRGELTACPTQGPFPRWMTLRGIGDTPGKFLIKNIEDKHMQVYAPARQLLESKAFKPRNGCYWAYLVSVMPSDLGFEGAVTYTEILERGQDCGLELCDPEVGPMLRYVIDNNHHEARQWYTIAMRPLGPMEEVFRLKFETSDGTLALDTERVKNRTYTKDTSERIVFMIRP